MIDDAVVLMVRAVSTVLDHGHSLVTCMDETLEFLGLVSNLRVGGILRKRQSALVLVGLVPKE